MPNRILFNKGYSKYKFNIMKRNSDEIIAMILTVCLTPKSKTRIFHACNINSITLEKYLAPLVMSGHITIVDGKTGKRYQTTEKGKQLLATIKEIQEFI